MAVAEIAKNIPASEMLALFIPYLKEYEDNFLRSDPKVAEAYRYIGVYRVLTCPMLEMFPDASWLAQLVLETELQRDNAKIRTAEDLDAYIDNFTYKLEFYNLGLKANKTVKRLVSLAFNNIYDVKGFNDEE